MKLKPMAISAALALLGLLAGEMSVAADKAVINARTATTLRHFYALNHANRGLVRRAAGVLIFSRVVKGGAGVGGEFGEGELQIKGKPVDYYSIGLASVGLTLGLARHSEVILFMTPQALEKFRSSEGWSMGADTSVALVSQGAGGEYDSALIGKPVLAFLFGEKGLLGDVSLEGSKVTKIAATND